VVIEEVFMWKSWAIYTAFSLIGLLIIGLVWGKKRDQKDEMNKEAINNKKKKIYVNLFLEPIEDQRPKEVERARRNPNEHLYEEQALNDGRASVASPVKGGIDTTPMKTTVMSPVKGSVSPLHNSPTAKRGIP
jgi:hypothetical protein